jgi:hypothetical protein
MGRRIGHRGDPDRPGASSIDVDDGKGATRHSERTRDRATDAATPLPPMINARFPSSTCPTVAILGEIHQPWECATGLDRRPLRGSHADEQVEPGGEYVEAYPTPQPLPVLSTRRRTGIEPAWELSPPHRF